MVLPMVRSQRMLWSVVVSCYSNCLNFGRYQSGLLSNPSLSRENLNLSCGNNHLNSMEVCLSKDLRPVSCTGLRKCSANVIKIIPMTSVRR
jgi:hypothetical protein